MPPFRSKQSVTVHAPLETVWAYAVDLTNIPEFHPRVAKVDLLSGSATRGAGVSYRCHLSSGKPHPLAKSARRVGHEAWCVEKDVEIVPLEKIVTALPDDTFGISKILNDYLVETTFHRIDDSTTRVEIAHYYSTNSLKAKIVNLIARGKIARDTQATLDSAKRLIESRVAGAQSTK